MEEAQLKAPVGLAWPGAYQLWQALQQRFGNLCSTAVTVLLFIIEVFM